MAIAWSDLSAAQRAKVAKALCAALHPFVTITRAQAWQALCEASPAIVWNGETFHIAEESKTDLALSLSAILTED